MNDPVGDGINDALKGTIADLAERSFSFVRGVSKAEIDKMRLRLVAGFSVYLKETRKRCGKVKTLISRADPVNIADAYVPALVESERLAKTEPQLIEYICEGNHAIISGMAGCGKSMTMKHIFITLCDKTKNKIPVFVELRDVQFDQDKNIINYIVDQLSKFSGDIHPDALKFGLLNGKFILILDGFDEIPFEFKEIAERQLVQIAADFPSCPILVSSRKDQRFVSWHSFKEFEVQPLTERQVEELIRKIRYPEKTKTKFIKSINDGLYHSHRELLSNPLLATMMLMTFEEFSEIPSKMHIFYRQAFEVLFSRHDATKPDFRRKFFTDLSIDDFERLFSNFCAMTFLDRKYSFSNSEINSYINRAVTYDGNEVNCSDFMKDLVDSVCIILPDGDRFGFLHRSFQEYFCATFLATRDINNFSDFIDHIIKTDFDEGVTALLAEMNLEVIEKRYVSHKLREVYEEVVNKKGDVKSVLALFFSDVIVSSEGNLSFSVSLGDRTPPYFYMLRLIADIYRLRELYILGSADAKDAYALLKSVGEERRQDHVSLAVEGLNAGTIEMLGLNNYVDRVLVSFETLLSSIETKEASRKTMLSEMLMPNSAD